MSEQCLAHELSLSGISFKIQLPLPVKYKGIKLDCGYRIDLLVNDELIVELKSFIIVPKVVVMLQLCSGALGLHFPVY